MRLLKLSEEVGEVMQAYIGMTGQNPRKGVTHSRDDVAAELCDVILTAMTALHSFAEDPEATFTDVVRTRNARLAQLIGQEYSRCPAAHNDDPSECEGPQDAVRIVDQTGAEILACVHHGARLYASLDKPLAHSVTVQGAAREVYTRAQTIPPCAWHTTRK
jgi:NTP pyrophosphatase (non-canonical NTP hydrolase)